MMSAFRYDANAARNLAKDLEAYIKQLYVITKRLIELTSSRTFWDDSQKKKYSNGVTMLKNDVVKAMEAEAAYLEFYNQIKEELER